MIVGRRRPVLLVAGVAVLALLILLVTSGSGPPGFDTSIHQWLLRHRHTWATDLAKAATTAGSSPVLSAALVALAALLRWRSRGAGGDGRWRPVIALGVFAAGQLLRTGLSDLLHRTRPPRGDWISTATGWSMPSGHSSNSALAALLVLWSLWPYLRTHPSRRWAVAAAALFAGAVGWSRAYLGVHWPTDVLAGWVFAACWAGLAALVIGSGARAARSRRSEVAASPRRAAPGS